MMIVLHAFVLLSYAIVACTSEGCIASPLTNITTLEAPPAAVEAPTLQNVTSNSVNVSWSRPATQNGEVTDYVLQLDNEEIYRGSELSVALSDLQPHTSYQLLLSACTSGGCTASAAASAVTEEAPPTGLSPPALKVVFRFKLAQRCQLLGRLQLDSMKWRELHFTAIQPIAET